ncbi:AMP-binding protein [Streptomyces spiramenti]|uniref:D-alanine--poly(Phosphoribitol) ligase n=1 Tax=Streptomyces spiramenti TaxID=2720606 RepID=A0ABX1AHV8_9ACTN|nr:AMP-binding protein [Streptomyces spiramenti]NJP66743.1 D-alanine--poly(phosphoribitol) ligase [Streptomyces spiramenti]
MAGRSEQWEKTTLPALFLRGLAHGADREALRVGGAGVSYGQLHRQALEWAGALRRAAPGRPVGVLATGGVTAYAGVLAALYSGSAVVPVHPSFPPDHVRRMLGAASVGTVIADAAGTAALAALARPSERAADRPAVLAPDPQGTPPPGWPRLESDPERAAVGPHPLTEEDTAYLLFTSGSTGTPKGVRISHANAAAYFRVLDGRYDFRPDDTFSQTFDLNFDCAMFDLFCAWGSGARVVHVPAGAYPNLPRFLAAENVTVWFSAPSTIGLVRRTCGLAPGSLPTLRWSFFAGEALRNQDAADWQRAADNSAVENLYGPTELTVTIAAHRFDAGADPGNGGNGGVPIGTVHPGHRQLLLRDDGTTVIPGEEGASGEGSDPGEDAEGELCVSGPQLTPGYLDPTHGEGRFLEVDGARYYRTGDRVRRAAGGELLYLGRRDNQVQIQGRRVELAEIDHALSGCSTVAEAVTLAVHGDAGTDLVVFYTGTPVPPGALARELREALPPGVLPKHYQHLDRLPLNSNRKVDRKVLSETARSLVVGRRQDGFPLAR